MKNMKNLLTRITALLLIFAMIVSLTTIKSDAVNGSQAIAIGIDVSKWQGNVNWAQVKASGVSFAFIKCYSAKSGVDPYFAQNVTAANAAGIRTGVYVYSYATSVEGAIAEANAVISIIQNYPVSYPVAIDLEDSSQKNLSPDTLAAMANAFCATIENAGYHPMVYANKTWFTKRIGYVPYDKWVAQYAGACDYGQVPAVWQASCTASVAGVGGQVDYDYLYKDYSFIVPQGFSVVNGYKYFYNNYRRVKGWVDYAGQRYYCDPVYSYVRTGWLPGANGTYYYMGDDGAMSTGFRQIGADLYYFAEDGIMRTGLVDVGTDKYLFAGDGKMYTGFWSPGDFMYYFGGDGKMVKGLQDIGGYKYYFDDLGHMQVGLATIGQGTYFFNANGQMQFGKVNTGAGIMYFGADGNRMVGLLPLSDGTCYFDPTTGLMQVGLVNLADGARYFEPTSGKMMAGLIDAGSTKYYADPATGILMAGVIQDAKGIRYFDPADYHMSVGLIALGGANFYMDPTTGYLVKNQTVTVGGHTYACDASGVAVLVK